MAEVRILSHPLCPLAQRCRLVLLKKGFVLGRDFEMDYVDLSRLPDWFRVRSPSGRMPMLELDGEIVSYETSNICEYLDETCPPRLGPDDARLRLRHRDAIVRADRLLDALKGVFTATRESSLDSAISEVFDQLAPVELELRDRSRFYNGHRFSLVDAAFAPFFSLFLFFEATRSRAEWDLIPRVRAWGEALLEDPLVTASRCPSYHDEFLRFFDRFGSAFVHRTGEPMAARYASS